MKKIVGLITGAIIGAIVGFFWFNMVSSIFGWNLEEYMGGEAWSFEEYAEGETFDPVETWSAAVFYMGAARSRIAHMRDTWTWSIESVIIALIIFSPFFFPTIVGAISGAARYGVYGDQGLFYTIVKCIIVSILSCILWIPLFLELMFIMAFIYACIEGDVGGIIACLIFLGIAGAVFGGGSRGILLIIGTRD